MRSVPRPLAVAIGGEGVLLLVHAGHWSRGDGGSGVAAMAAMLGALVLLTGAALRPERDRVVALVAGLTAVLAVVVVGRFLGALADGVPPEYGFYTVKLRLTTPVGAHNVLAGLLLPGTVLLVLRSRRSWWWASGAAVATVGLTATLSRGAVLVFAVVAVASWFVRGPVGDRVALAGAAVGAGVGVLAAALALGAAPPPAEGASVAEGSVLGRTELWGVAVDVAADHPLVGAGVEGFEDHTVEADVAVPRDHAHDGPLQAAATGGIVGLTGWLAVWATAVVVAWRQRSAGGAVLLAVGALATHGLIEELALRPAVEVLAALLLLAAADPRPSPVSVHPTSPARLSAPRSVG